MKRLLPMLLCVLLVFNLSACKFNPPEGYTEEHHTYQEILEFAKSIDHNAEVSDKYTDTKIEAWNRNFREYPAIINGVECHVSSVGDLVWNDGFAAGEFCRQYFVIDTDYDYLVLNQIVSEKEPDWKIPENNIGNRYNWNNLISVYIEPNLKEQLTDEELETMWQRAKEIYSAYNNLPIRKNLFFCLPAPEKSINYNGDGKEFVRLNAYVYIESFSENDRLKLIKQYKEAWKLLESDLPVYEVATEE